MNYAYRRLGIFKCQDCGAIGAELVQDPETRRMICADQEACEVMQEFNTDG